jgi:hypothetical protein
LSNIDENPNNHIFETKAENCPYCGSKRYHVHGKVEKNNITGKTEVSYFECDNIVCKKVFIRKEEE